MTDHFMVSSGHVGKPRGLGNCHGGTSQIVVDGESDYNNGVSLVLDILALLKYSSYRPIPDATTHPLYPSFLSATVSFFCEECLLKVMTNWNDFAHEQAEGGPFSTAPRPR
jgi:hypothetical protein